MFTGLILLAVLAILAVTVVGAAVKAAVSTIRKGVSGQEQKPKEEPEKETRKVEPIEEKKAQEQVQTVSTEQEEAMGQLAGQGIGEVFWTDKTAIELDGKTLADLAVSGSPLSYMEFNNRHLADEGFVGYNIEVRDGEMMALTYRGKVLVTLTKVEEKARGKEDAEDTGNIMYRTNVFPPVLGKDMAISELAEILEVTRSVSACNGDPCRVADVMLDTFLQASNVRHLRSDIGEKIREKETKRLREEQQKALNEKQPQMIGAKHSV